MLSAIHKGRSAGTKVVYDGTACQAGAELLSGIVLQPPAGDFVPAGEPDPGELTAILEELFQAAGAGRTAGDAAMETHRHHFRVGATLLIEAVEGLLQVFVEVV